MGFPTSIADGTTKLLPKREKNIKLLSLKLFSHTKNTTVGNSKWMSGIQIVTRPFCLVESHSQDAATNAGVLSVYLTINNEKPCHMVILGDANLCSKK